MELQLLVWTWLGSVYYVYSNKEFNRRFGVICLLHIQGTRMSQARNQHEASNDIFLRNFSQRSFVSQKTELHSHHCENLRVTSARKVPCAQKKSFNKWMKSDMHLFYGFMNSTVDGKLSNDSPYLHKLILKIHIRCRQFFVWSWWKSADNKQGKSKKIKVSHHFSDFKVLKRRHEYIYIYIYIYI
jgi:hypothetical protein